MHHTKNDFKPKSANTQLAAFEFENGATRLPRRPSVAFKPTPPPPPPADTHEEQVCFP